MSCSWKCDAVKKQTNNKPEPEILEPEPSRKPTGRPSSYTFEVSEEICHQMAGGKGLRQICARDLSHFVINLMTDRRLIAARRQPQLSNNAPQVSACRVHDIVEGATE